MEQLYLSIALVVFLILALVGLRVWLFLKRVKDRRRKAREQVFYRISVPENSEIEIKAAEQMFAAFSGLRLTGLGGLTTEPDHLSFEIVGTQNKIEFYVSCPARISDMVLRQIHSSYPEANFEKVKPWSIWKAGTKVDFGTLDLTGSPFFPIKTYEDLSTDPLIGVLSSLSKLDENEGAAVQFLIKPAAEHWRNDGKGFVDSTRFHNQDQTKKHLNIPDALLTGVEKKISKPGFDVCLRLVAAAPDKLAATLRVNELISAFEPFGDPVFSRFKKLFELSRKGFMESFLWRLFPLFYIEIPIFHLHLYNPTFTLNTSELATLFHLPNKDVTVPGIQYLKARLFPAPSNAPKEGLYLGNNSFRGVDRQIFMNEKDRNRHMYILGQTGTGKSQFMMQLAVQDMKDGKGLAFIDPHGSDIEELLKKVPKERLQDVILFDAGDLERPMGLNLLEAHSEEEKHFLVNSFIQLLYKLYDPNHQGIMGPQLERAVRNVMLTAMEDPESTMVDVQRLLIDQKYAKERGALVKDPVVRRYWTDEYAKTTDSQKGEKMGYFVSKFDRFVTERIMRNILGQAKSAFNFREVMDTGKILLIDLSKGKVGEENSIFLGLLFVPRILSAALSRVDVPEEQRRDFFLYVDEFQNFATPDFATILSEARKYHLNLIVGNQFIAQMDDKVKEAVFGNVGTQCIFRVGPEDAEFLEPQFEPQFTKADLTNNPTGAMYIRLLANNQPLTPFSLKVDWDAITNTPKSDRVAESIRSYCRHKYGRDRRLVEAEINERNG